MDVLHFNEIAETIKKMILEQAGLNLSQTRILLFFDETENDSLTMGELAKGLNISLSTLSQLRKYINNNFIIATVLLMFCYKY